MSDHVNSSDKILRKVCSYVETQSALKKDSVFVFFFEELWKSLGQEAFLIAFDNCILNHMIESTISEEQSETNLTQLILVLRVVVNMSEETSANPMLTHGFSQLLECVVGMLSRIKPENYKEENLRKLLADLVTLLYVSC